MLKYEENKKEKANKCWLRKEENEITRISDYWKLRTEFHDIAAKRKINNIQFHMKFTATKLWKLFYKYDKVKLER